MTVEINYEAEEKLHIPYRKIITKAVEACIEAEKCPYEAEVSVTIVDGPAIRELNRELHMAVLFITHDLGVVSELCDRIIVMYTGHIVEEATTRALFDAPKHPYTEGLIQAIPEIRKERSPLRTIKGSVPNPLEKINGCSFAPRCPYASDTCHREAPPLFHLNAERSVRCWRYAEEGGGPAHGK